MADADQVVICQKFRKGNPGKPNKTPCLDCGTLWEDHYREHADKIPIKIPFGKYATCQAEGCQGPHYAKSYCRTHYTRLIRTGSIFLVSGKLCTYPGCSKEHRALGYCALHYSRVYKSGSPNPTTRAVQMNRENKYALFVKMLRALPKDFDLTSLLTIREWQVLKTRFGLNSDLHQNTESCSSLSQISKVYKLSRERIRQIESQALEKIRKHSNTMNNNLIVLDTRAVKPEDQPMAAEPIKPVSNDEIVVPMQPVNGTVAQSAKPEPTPVESTEPVSPEPVVTQNPKLKKNWIKITKPSDQYSVEELRNYRLYGSLRKTAGLEKDAGDAIVLKMIRDSINTYWESERKQKLSKLVKEFYQKAGILHSLVIRPDGSFQDLSPTPSVKPPFASFAPKIARPSLGQFGVCHTASSPGAGTSIKKKPNDPYRVEGNKTK